MDDVKYHIDEAIKAAQSLPNSKERNKVVSKLEDASAWTIAANYGHMARQQQPDSWNLPKSADCICPPGARDGTCPVHGVQS